MIKHFKSRLFQNVMALYGAQAGRKIIPLLSIPWLTRALGPSGWGMVAFVMAMGDLIVILIEFGFNLSATREIARHRDSPARCSEVMSGVVGAQLLLATFGMLLFAGVAQFLPSLRNDPRLVASGMAYALANGFMPLWFFQGLERMRTSASLELSGKITALFAVFAFVHHPDDGWKALLAGSIPPAVITLVGFVLALRAIPFERPCARTVREAMRMGWPMFLFRSSESLYGVANSFLLGLFAPARFVGYFSPAEKISKAAFGLLNPIREAVYPRLSHLAARRHADAAYLAKISAAVMIGGGVLLAGGVIVFAPLLVKLLMGSAFAPTVTALRILAVLPALLAVTYAVGLQWLLPLGQDHVVNRIIIGAGILNITLSCLLAPRFLHVGMAVAVVCSEAFVSMAMVVAVMRISPFWGAKPCVAVAGGQA